jgi:hypothetical protein
MDLVTVLREEQGNKREWSRRIFGECEGGSRRYSRENPNRRKACRAPEWTGMRWTSGKWKMAAGGIGFISRNPFRSCGGLKYWTRERDSTTPSSRKLLAPPRNLLHLDMVNSACLLDSHAPRHQASPQSPTSDHLSFLGSSPSRTRVYTGN